MLAEQTAVGLLFLVADHVSKRVPGPLASPPVSHSGSNSTSLLAFPPGAIDPSIAARAAERRKH